MGKPRMTRSDKWKKRPAVMRYRAFKDECRLHNVALPELPCITFYMPMPASWSKKKKADMDGQPHKSKPDLDNILKALFDALYEDDAHIWYVTAKKIWSYDGKIEITPLTV
jgi:Holliday junction resolvase RusA-like endonuclease